MKIMTILGTRPELIRLSLVIRLLDRFAEHVLVHTGQNYDDRLSRIFFDELGIRDPDVYMGVKADGFGGQMGQILERGEALFLKHRPDRLLILGDTNSGISAIVARRLGIPVYHMEAGNRCCDDRVPEEVNRRIIDHSSSILMPYTDRSRENLLAEGFSGHRIHVIGNPIKQVIDSFASQIAASQVLKDLRLQEKGFFLVTAHRAENVDCQDRLKGIIRALEELHQSYDFPVVVSLHPRTRAKIEAFGLSPESVGVQYILPLGFFDFIRLEQSAFCIISDSGTVQEEACIFGVPNVTIRDVTERPETLDCGSNVLCGAMPDDVLRAVRMVTAQSDRWKPPEEYLAPTVAETVCRIVLGYRLPDTAELDWRRNARSCVS
jgi:UDP-N-acetylglucosamine 2-epimerase (non-hydrolysing)